MKILSLFFFKVLIISLAFAQSNMVSTNPLAEQIMLGNYDPDIYAASIILSHPDTLVKDINKNISPDSLKKYLEILSTFQNRNTGSDTVSNTRGIGAARRWAFSKFEQFSAENENRLIPSYLQFDLSICGVSQHRNVFAVLPGSDTSDKSIVIIEAHMDSRCADQCDTSCTAEGMEDNGSGTALVLELARVMSKYTLNQTLVFLITVGEEQGLYGAEAFADYVQSKGIEVKAVMNNDITGGIICGQTSSPPSCPGLSNIDSTQVRLFSQGGFNSVNKGLARFVKLQYKEELLPIVTVPMTVSIMSAEDRTGRGGDHIPFRQHGYPAIRYTSANEHGDGSNGVGYSDRQHTTDDILGIDTNGDLIIDSFFVDFNYLSRNTTINGVAAAMMGIGPKSPDFTFSNTWVNKLIIEVNQQTQYLHYRIGVRSSTNDWDSVYTFSGALIDTIEVSSAATHYVSIASVDSNGIESLFSREYMVILTGINEDINSKNISLLQTAPNPADEATIISVLVNNPTSYKKAYIEITDVNAKLIKRLPIELNNGMNEILYEHGYNVDGIYFYSLFVDGRCLQTNKMIFAN